MAGKKHITSKGEHFVRPVACSSTVLSLWFDKGVMNRVCQSSRFEEEMEF